jgi:hypothetical protein
MNQKIRLNRVSQGHYRYKHFDLIKWIPDTGSLRYLWCLAIDGVGLDDFRTLSQAKKHILNNESKSKIN